MGSPSSSASELWTVTGLHGVQVPCQINCEQCHLCVAVPILLSDNT